MLRKTLVGTLDLTLEALCAGLPAGDARALREERAGILEHEAGLPRDQAGRMAGLAALPDTLEPEQNQPAAPSATPEGIPDAPNA